MILLLFNAFGDDFFPSIFVERFPVKGVEIFEKGKPMSYGKNIHTQSGLSVPMEAAATTSDVIPQIESFISKNRNWLLPLKEQSVELLFNIGITVGGNDAYVPCLELKTGFLNLLAESNIGLNIYGYPTSSDEPD